jgi:hypothetical protein
MSKQKENVIREQRTIEATKKNFMGPSGKFGMILQAFGTPVIRQGTGLFDSSYMDDPYGDEVYSEYGSTASGQRGPLLFRDEIATTADENFYNEGLIFDGLSRGIHLEIVYWHYDSRLQVSFKGYPVYIEIAGELEAYAPTDEWENIIERLAKAGKDRLKSLKKQQEEEIGKKLQEKKASFLQRIRTKWGV